MSKTKICICCKKRKLKKSFYSHVFMRDGTLNKCKRCVQEYARKRRIEFPEIAHEHDKRSYEKKKKNLIYLQREKQRHNDFRKNNPGKYKSRHKVSNAVRDGRLENGKECSQCGATERIEAHHPDYRKPLEVIWLCILCHRRAHSKYA